MMTGNDDSSQLEAKTANERFDAPTSRLELRICTPDVLHLIWQPSKSPTKYVLPSLRDKAFETEALPQTLRFRGEAALLHSATSNYLNSHIQLRHL